MPPPNEAADGLRSNRRTQASNRLSWSIGCQIANLLLGQHQDLGSDKFSRGALAPVFAGRTVSLAIRLIPKIGVVKAIVDQWAKKILARLQDLARTHLLFRLNDGLSEQLQGVLRILRRDRQDLRTGTDQNLSPSQVRAFDGKVGVADRAFGFAQVDR